MEEIDNYMTADQGRHSFKIKDVPRLTVDTYKNWMASEPFKLSAIVAYYAILSLPALVVIILNIVGAVWGRDIVQGELLAEITKVLGQETAESIRLMMVDRGDEETGFFTATVGILVLLYGATGVFFQLQQALDTIWGVNLNEQDGIFNIIKSRAKGFGFILIIGFLLLISFIATSLLSAFSNRLAEFLPASLIEFIFIIDISISLIVIYTLFAALFKFLPSVYIRWKAVRVGAGLTTILFILGEVAMAYYFNTMEPGSTYGAAGSIILIMLWVSYSSLILFFGANFTRVYADAYYNKARQLKTGVGFRRFQHFKKKEE
ncbi:YihY/virulence factor BrkB family protein [Dokdonia sp. PRO95]|uniref:YihY/virulence factor BrkB family protein n=1 Tax=Dokdonia sp. PRO95 TaxID=1239415 RepID=UPI0005569BD3|nr:YihY/virulence factor BrkB family protein [Dokdonia sp. PRO95]